MNPETRLDLYLRMLRIRRVEEAIADNYSKQQMKCPVHLSIGQEAVPAAISLQLDNEDRVYSSHRCHAHYLAKGGNLNSMIAELHGKVSGCAKGKGGSMHLVDPSVGMMGSSALVAGSIPLAVGSALALKRAQSGAVAVAYFGDGGSEEGIFFECLNFAALKALPVLFVCENNNYATYSPQSARQGQTEIFKKAIPFGVPSEKIDGYDLDQVFDASTTAIRRARSGNGPTLLEFTTCRWRDHVGPSGDIEVGYRTQEELDGWVARCPLNRLQHEMIATSELSEVQRLKYESDLKKEIENAFRLAESDPFPSEFAIFEDIYA